MSSSRPHSANPDQTAPVSSRYRRGAWAFLLYSVAVILWGALVRASLSGDGCGDHWPLCNGDVVPPDPTTKTVIEFTHRLTSGLAWIFAAAFWWVSRRYGGLVKRGAKWVFFFMTTEALVGAGLVLTKMVADNPDAARGYWAAAHLLNTFALLYALTLHAYWASGGHDRKLTGTNRWLVGLTFLLLCAVGASGAIAALGDTLFPASDLAAGLAADFDPDAHIFVRLRTFHPLLALGGALLSLILSVRAYGEGSRVAIYLGAFTVLQVGAGFLNVMLLAPVWLQLTHLLIADALWISLVLVARDLATLPEARAQSVDSTAPIQAR